MESVRTFFSNLFHQLPAFRISDAFDILIVAVMLYLIYRFMRERRAGKLGIGVLLLFAIRVLSEMLEMHMLVYLLDAIFKVGLIALIVLFQPELRSALEKFGGQPLRSIRTFGEQKDVSEKQRTIGEVSSACADMSESRTGALIVFQRSTRLGDIIHTGTVIDADVNAPLLKNIFFNKAPMHDGATVIVDDRICSAGCFLPLSMNQNIIKDLGTRHRAGIGMSENSDAVVVIVSEETGVISCAVGGNLTSGYDKDSLRTFLCSQLIEENLYGKFRKRSDKMRQKAKEDETDENEQ